jgi:hypothetical protein
MKALHRTIDSDTPGVVAGRPLRQVLAYSIFWLVLPLAISAGAATPVSNVVAVVHPADRPACQRGYKLRGGSLCVPVTVPANAHIDQSGHEWECDRDYHKNGGVCVRNSGVPQGTSPPALNDSWRAAHLGALTQFTSKPGVEVAIFGRCGYHALPESNSPVAHAHKSAPNCHD